MIEARTNPRHLTLKTAKIVFDDMSSPIDCAILNISDGGACILVPRFAEIPNAFRLVVDPDGMTHACTVRWKSGNQVGLAFLDEQTP
jgi:hypothetical protein